MTYHAFHLTSTLGSKSLFFNAPDVFLKRRGVSFKTSGRFKKTFGFPKTGKDSSHIHKTTRQRLSIFHIISSYFHL